MALDRDLEIRIVCELVDEMKEGRIRFHSIFISDRTINDPKIDELKEWCAKFQKNQLTPQIEGNYTGNLSFRFGQGFVITASGLKSKDNLKNSDFVYVRAYFVHNNSFYVEGTKVPSSESVMHALIYMNHKDVNAVFHGHNEAVVKNAERFGLPITQVEYDSGTIALAEEVLKVLDNNRLIVLKNHGFVSIGEDMCEAGEVALDVLNQSKIVSSDNM